MTSRQVSLSVNEEKIETDYFVQGFIDHTIGGMLTGLEGTGEIKSLDLVIEGDKVNITLNDSEVSLNPFPSRIIRNTITGMISSLKGVSAINRMTINIRR